MLAQNPGPAAPQPAPGKLPLKAAIVFSLGFCATRKRQSIAIKDVLYVGRAACEQLYAALAPVFSDLQRLEIEPVAGSGTAQMTLIPRFVDISATRQPFRPSSERKLVILLEWTVRDASGHMIWLQTVKGSSERKAGWGGTTKGVAALVNSAVDELAKDSVARISTSPEIQGTVK